jgi:hypothetical protein
VQAAIGKRSARGYAIRHHWCVVRVFALCWLLPAMLFNVDWTGHGSWQANTAAVFMILGSALFIEGALRLRSWVLSPICVVAALFLVYVNTKQATRILSLASEAASEAKSAEIAVGSHLASQRSHLLARRQTQTENARETTVGALQAQLEALQLSDPRTWNATSKCEDVTAKPSGSFCARVAAARAKIEAAKERDKIDAHLAKLPVPPLVSAPNTEAPVADAYVANVIALLMEAGFKPSERLIKAEEAMARALGFELLAALGPTCWLAFVNMLALGAAHIPARSVRALSKQRAKGEANLADLSEPASATENADDLDRCIADVFEDAPAGRMSAKEMRPLVQAWFAARNKPKPVETELWGKMGQRFKRDPNNGRPRYLGLKPRAKAPPKLAFRRAGGDVERSFAAPTLFQPASGADVRG